MNDLSLPEQGYATHTEGKTFGIRAAAYIIDTIIYSITNLMTQLTVGIVLGVALAISGGNLTINEESSSIQCINILMGLLIFALYFTVFETLYGASPGKAILGMRVVQENGEACGFGPAFVRALLRYIDGLFFGIPAYSSMQAPLYQRLGDKSAKTIVVGVQNPIIKQPAEIWSFFMAAGLYLVLNITLTIIALIFVVG